MATSSSWTSIIVFTLTVLVGISFVEGYCGSREFTCHGDSQCIPLLWQCDDHDDCADGSDELDCSPKVCDLETKFKCTNSSGCVPIRWECDGETDCADGSDEDPQKCSLKTCASDQFSCGVGQPCIPSTWKCDTHADCPNGEDEHGCDERSCVAEEFQCTNGQCITMRWYCDLDNDCGDNSDELNCPPSTCPPGEYLCGNSTRCIPEAWRCDGDRDCSDGSDENTCGSSTPPIHSHCSANEFMCQNYECVHKGWKCDGEMDCVDGSDELDCQVSCRSDQFTCGNGRQCIPGFEECDGYAQCADGSDESDLCPELVPKCTEAEFDCTLDGTHCIPLSSVCDGSIDCAVGEDEDRSMCAAQNPCLDNKGGCDHQCINTHRGHQCACNPGYQLTSDNKTCIDVDECKVKGTCSQLCRNTVGSFHCMCLEGYTRDPSDHRYCKASGEEPTLLFSNRYDMRMMGLHTGKYSPVLDKLKAAIGLDYDYNNKKVYYTDVALEQIRVASIVDGKVNNQSSLLIGHSVNTPDGIALDWVHQNLYWTDTGLNTIEVMNLETKYRKILFNTELDEPRAIVVDPRDNQGWIYWTDWGSVAKIERAGMDGSARKSIVHSDIRWPNGLTIDYTLNRIYWVDAKLHQIGSSDLDGKFREVVLISTSYLQHPFSITVFEDNLYWSDWETESIHSVRKFKNATQPNEVSNKVLSLQSPMDVRVYHSYKQPQGSNRCSSDNGGCSHMCLPSPKYTMHSAEFSCHCPVDMKLNEDGRSCYSITTPPPSTTKQPISSPNSTPTVTDGQGETYTKPADTSDQNVGKIAGIVVGIISALVLITALIGFFVYRSLMGSNIKSLNFDNPVYRKTTEDTFSLEKHQYQPSKTLPPTLEPLTAGTNEYV